MGSSRTESGAIKMAQNGGSHQFLPGNNDVSYVSWQNGETASYTGFQQL